MVSKIFKKSVGFKKKFTLNEFIRIIGINKIKRFLLVGLLNTTTSYILIILLFSWLRLDFYFSNFIGYLFGFVISFILNKNFVFKVRGKGISQFLKFIISFGLSYFLNTSVLYISYDFMNLNKYFSLLLAAVTYTTSFFILCNCFTFRNEFPKKY